MSFKGSSAREATLQSSGQSRAMPTFERGSPVTVTLRQRNGKLAARTRSNAQAMCMQYL